MAGSFNHLVDTDGTMTTATLDFAHHAPKDTREAFEECYALILYLANGKTSVVSAACRALGFVDPWDDEYGDDPKQPMRATP